MYTRPYKKIFFFQEIAAYLPNLGKIQHNQNNLLTQDWLKVFEEKLLTTSNALILIKQCHAKLTMIYIHYFRKSKAYQILKENHMNPSYDNNQETILYALATDNIYTINQIKLEKAIYQWPKHHILVKGLRITLSIVQNNMDLFLKLIRIPIPLSQTQFDLVDGVNVICSKGIEYSFLVI